MYKDFYWITPEGKIMRPKTEEFHYEIILSNPKVFGYKDKAEAIKFYEERGGDADALRIPAICSGFIRVRSRPGGLWLFQMVKYGEQERINIKKFLKKEGLEWFLTYNIMKVDREVPLSGKLVDFFEEKEIPDYDKNEFPPPRNTEEGRKKGREELKKISFDDSAKYKHLLVGKFKMQGNNAMNVKEDVDISKLTFGEYLTA